MVIILVLWTQTQLGNCIFSRFSLHLNSTCLTSESRSMKFVKLHSNRCSLQCQSSITWLSCTFCFTWCYKSSSSEDQPTLGCLPPAPFPVRPSFFVPCKIPVNNDEYMLLNYTWTKMPKQWCFIVYWLTSRSSTFGPRTPSPSGTTSGSWSWRSPCDDHTQTWAESRGCLSEAVAEKRAVIRGREKSKLFIHIYWFQRSKSCSWVVTWCSQCTTLRRVLAKVAASWRRHQGSSVWAIWVGWSYVFLCTVAIEKIRLRW